MTDQELKDLVASLAIDRKETDKQLKKMAEEAEKSRKENEKSMKELRQQIGGIANKFGSFTEGLVLPSMTKILTKKFGMTTINPSVRVRDKEGNEHEIDVLAYANGEINTAFIVEVKSHLREEGIEQLLNQCRLFPKLFPELADKLCMGFWLRWMRISSCNKRCWRRVCILPKSMMSSFRCVFLRGLSRFVLLGSDLYSVVDIFCL